MEEPIEFPHDSRLHDLLKESVLLSQLLGAEMFPLTCLRMIVVEEIDEGCVGWLGEQLLVDRGEEPEG